MQRNAPVHNLKFLPAYDEQGMGTCFRTLFGSPYLAYVAKVVRVEFAKSQGSWQVPNMKFRPALLRRAYLH